MSAASGRRTGRIMRRALFYLGLVLVLGVFVFPFFWMALNSFKTHDQITEYPPVFFFTPTLENVRNVFAQGQFVRYTWNSIVVSFGAVGLGMLLGLPAAYAIARHRQRGFAFGILVCRMIPGIAFLVPWFIVSA
jgi:multiple sugar transport system permease protein